LAIFQRKSWFHPDSSSAIWYECCFFEFFLGEFGVVELFGVQP